KSPGQRCLQTRSPGPRRDSRGRSSASPGSRSDRLPSNDLRVSDDALPVIHAEIISRRQGRQSMTALTSEGRPLAGSKISESFENLGAGLRFGTEGSLVQIQSPRPFHPKNMDVDVYVPSLIERAFGS